METGRSGDSVPQTAKTGTRKIRIVLVCSPAIEEA